MIAISYWDICTLSVTPLIATIGALYALTSWGRKRWPAHWDEPMWFKLTVGACILVIAAGVLWMLALGAAMPGPGEPEEFRW